MPRSPRGTRFLSCGGTPRRARLLITGLILGLALAGRAATYTNQQTLWTFPSVTGDPYAPVTEGSDGFLYGTTYGASSTDLGAVFKVDKNGNNFAVLHRFTSSEGDTPSAPVTEATNGVLYGTTWLDGANGAGSLFLLNKDGSGFTVVHQFSYATNDGASPVAALLSASDGALYGTAQYGGAGAGDGVVFRLLVGETNITVLHSFVQAEGYSPQAGVIEGTNGALYGTTLSGGLSNAGTIYRLDKDGSNFQVMYHFLGGTNGTEPTCALLSGPGGKLYGTTSAGGLHNQGVVFSIDYSGSNYTILHQFGTVPKDGNSPLSALVQAPDGALYGTTYFGGVNGTAFAVTPDGSSYSLVLQFAGTNGTLPNGLIIGSDNVLYGTCNGGGPNNKGTVFKLSGTVPERNVLAAPMIWFGTNWLISGHGTAGRVYTVQFATNLSLPITWVPLGSAASDLSGNWQLKDPTNAPSRFYRTSYP